MAYLGRPGATAPLTSADIPDNSITSAKIVAGTIEASDVAADMATQAELDLKAPITNAALVTPNLGIPSAGVVTNLSGVLPVGVTGGSGLTALGTVTAGNLSHTDIVYPAGHIVQVVYLEGNSSSSVENNSTWVDCGASFQKQITMVDSDNKVLVIMSGTAHFYDDGYNDEESSGTIGIGRDTGSTESSLNVWDPPPHAGYMEHLSLIHI